MHNFKIGLDRVLSFTAALGLLAMMTHLVVNALLRFSFNEPLFGTNEITAYWYLPIVALLGIPAAQMQKEQITVTLAIDRMGQTTADVFRIFANVMGILLSVGFAYFSLGLAAEKMALKATAGVTDIPAWPVLFLVPLTFVLLALLLALELSPILKGKGPDPALMTGNPSDPPVNDLIHSTEPSAATRDS